jgi:hypothetical protein
MIVAIKRVCNICGTDKNVITTIFAYNKKINSTGSVDDEYKNFDLCYKCYSHILKLTVY